jgi:DNA-binding beta-propeller fold protein YncE
VLVTPDGERGIAVLRRDNKLVPMEILPTGAVRLAEAVDTCDQPEQIELVRRARLAVVRCNRGRAVEIFNLDDASLVRRVPFGDPVLDLAVTPDGEQIVVAVAGASGGAVGLVDLESFSVEMVPLTEPPTRVDVSPRGDTVLALSDRSKVAWVIR